MTEIDRGALESERDFLLRSLDDLEDERATGNVDEGTYRALHDDYTARAAATIRSLAAGADLTPPAAPPASRLARTLTVGGIVAFALVAAVALTHAAGQRHPGQTITGNPQLAGSGPSTTLDEGRALATAARTQPKSYPAHIAYARYLLQNDDFTDALTEFGAAARLDPSQPEPPTYAAWAGALLAAPLHDPGARRQLLTASLERIDEVTKTDPKYPDAWALAGVIRFQFENDAAHAIPDLQHYLLLTTDSDPLRAQVLDLLAKAEHAASGPS